MSRAGIVHMVRLGAISVALTVVAGAGIWLAEQLLFRHLSWIG